MKNMVKKGRLKEVKPHPEDPARQIIIWEDQMVFRDVSEVVPSSWDRKKLKEHVKSQLIDINMKGGEMIEE